MKSLCLLSLLLAGTIAAQTAVADKPCISFVPESTSPTNTYAKGPLQAAVMLSGDFNFTQAATRVAGTCMFSPCR